MGYEIGYDDTWDRDIGYGVPAECDHPDCHTRIDRGLSYVCGGEPYGGELGCCLFFCEDHLFYAEKTPEYAQSPPSDAEMREYADVYGDETGDFVCERCRDWHAKPVARQRIAQERGEFKTFDPKLDIEAWAYHKATDPSWIEWRKEQGIPEMVSDD